MIDDGDVPGVIPSESGRSFDDGDGFAEISVWAEHEKRKDIVKPQGEELDPLHLLPK